MRCMKRNKQPTWYKMLTGTADVLDSNGLRTGETTKTYGDAIRHDMSVSTATGFSESRPYGTHQEYSYKLVTDDVDLPINENSLIFIRDMTKTYVVKRIARQLNTVSYYVDEVRTS